MAYAVIQDIVDRYGNDDLLVAAANEDDTLDTAAVNRALDDASAEIDAYIGQRYHLPLPSPSKILLALCVDMALYKLSTGTELTDEQRRRYEDAIKLLEKIGSGVVTLGLPTGDAAASPQLAELIGPERQFSRKKMNQVL